MTKVRDISSPDFIEGFSNMLRMLCENVGLPSKEVEKISNISLVMWAGRFQERYGYMGTDEMEIAVRASTIMEFRETPEHFHTLSEKYIYEIFDSYKEWAQVKLNEANRAIQEEEEEVSPEEARLDFILHTIIPAYTAFIERHEAIDEIAYPEIFESLQEAGVVEFSPEVKWSWMDQAKKSLQDKVDKSIQGLVDAFQAKVENVELSTVKIKRLAMTYACRAAFQELINKGYTVTQLQEILI